MSRGNAVKIRLTGGIDPSVKKSFTQIGRQGKGLRKDLSKLRMGKRLADDAAKYKKMLGRLQDAQGRLGTSNKRLNRRLATVHERYLRAEKAAAKYGIKVSQLSQEQNQYTRAVNRTEEALRRQKRIQEAKKQRKDLRGKAAGAVAGVGGMLYGAKKLITTYGDVASAQGELKSLDMDPKGIEAVTRAGKDFSNQWEGTTTPEFIKAAYDIKSGISSLGSKAVGEFTKIAALTGKATKSSTGEMTSLFATGFGIYRKQFEQFGAATIKGWHGLSDEEKDIKFGEYFSAGLSSAVKQFKTDGSQMSQAMETLGAAGTMAGASFAEQLAVMGALQQKMSGSVGATKYRRFLATAGKAGGKLGLEFTDEKTGMLKSVPDILKEIRKQYGATLDDAENQELAKAFGSEEAVDFLGALYDNVEAVETGITAMDKSLKGGMKTTKQMAKDQNEGPNESFSILLSRAQNLTATIGKSLSPMTIQLADALGQAAIWGEGLAEAFPNATAGVMGLIGAFALYKTAKIGLGFAKTFTGLAGGGREKKPGMFSRMRGRLPFGKKRNRVGGGSKTNPLQTLLGGGSSSPIPVFVTNMGSGGMMDLGSDAEGKKKSGAKSRVRAKAKGGKGGFFRKMMGKLNPLKLFGGKAGKIGLKALGKSALKKLPLIGGLAGLAFAVPKLLGGDLAGAGMEAASGLAGGLGPLGWLASGGLDYLIAKRDMAKEGTSGDKVAEQADTPSAQAVAQASDSGQSPVSAPSTGTAAGAGGVALGGASASDPLWVQIVNGTGGQAQTVNQAQTNNNPITVTINQAITVAEGGVEGVKKAMEEAKEGLKEFIIETMDTTTARRRATVL